MREQLRHAYLRRIIVPGLRLSGSRMTDGLATRVGRGLFRLGAPIRQIAMSRATRALGATHTHADITRIVESSFEHAARFWGESLFVRKRLVSQSWRQFVSIQASESGELAADGGAPDAIRKSDRARIYTSAYLGNPAVAAVALGRLIGRIHVVADFENQPVMRAWAEDMRRISCVRIVQRADAATQIPRILEDNEGVYILGEHIRWNGKGVAVRWLGSEISAYRTIGLLSAKFDAPVIPISCTRTTDSFRFNMTCEPAIDAAAHGKEPDAIVRAVFAALEHCVMKTPEQYLWAMLGSFESNGCKPIPSPSPASSTLPTFV